MKYIKKNAKELSRGFDCEYDKPSVCPHCGLGTDGQVVSSDFIDFDNGERMLLQVCSCTACKRYYFFIVLLNKETKSSRFVFLYPQYEYMYFNNNLNKISPRFMSMYNQALRCEGNGDIELAAIGYKSALEILVKDYAVNLLKTDRSAMKNKDIFVAVKEYLGSSDILKSNEAIRVFSNDYTHYDTTYPVNDFVLLKLFMDIFIKFVETKVIAYDETVQTEE